MTLKIPQSLPKIHGNTDMLLNALSNLISNANRFTHDGEITISAAVDSGQRAMEQDKNRRAEDHLFSTPNSRFITVAVMDNGEGIKPEFFPSIFKRGVSHSGTGLGLSIVKTIIEAHGGKISAESEYTKGTKVIFSLPVNDEGAKKDNKK